jgi:hypothetical protein
MSSNRSHVIPIDPLFVPEPACAQAALALFKQLLPSAADHSVAVHDKPEPIISAKAFDTVRCPLCHEEILDWWNSEAWPQAESQDFKDLSLLTPCCAKPAKLDSLDYDNAFALARFELSAETAGWVELSDELLAQMSQALRCPVKQAWSSI